MKKFIILLFAIFLSGCATQTTITNGVAPPTQIERKYDSMKEITWHYASNYPRYEDGMYLYFGKTDKGEIMPLRLVIRRMNSDWLFVKYAWAKIDGERVELPQAANWEREVVKGPMSTEEWSDFVVSDVAIIKRIIASRDMTVRLEGRQYYADYPVSPKAKQAMQTVLSAWESFNTAVPVKQGRPSITFSRDSGFWGSGCSHYIFVDDDQVAVLDQGKSETIFVSPGSHIIRLAESNKGLCSNSAEQKRRINVTGPISVRTGVVMDSLILEVVE